DEGTPMSLVSQGIVTHYLGSIDACHCRYDPKMFAVLALVFIVVPLVELYVIVQVGQAIGVWDTIGLLLLSSIVGALLARHEGFVVIGRVRERLERGEVPGRELLDGMLILAGGLLMVVPGFVTDAIGILLLFPPTRALARLFVQRRFALRVEGGPPRGPGPPPVGGGDDIIDI
ncbi:MAG: protein FxsA, partial [Actinomycetota bacterium]|nr:protein FxsA [Actinomycetota bacterium]